MPWIQNGDAASWLCPIDACQYTYRKKGLRESTRIQEKIIRQHLRTCHSEACCIPCPRDCKDACTMCVPPALLGTPIVGAPLVDLEIARSGKRSRVSVSDTAGHLLLKRARCDTKSCVVCGDHFAQSRGLSCCRSVGPHFLCCECLEGYLRAEFEAGRGHALSCPECFSAYEHRHLSDKLGPASRDMFERALAAAAERCILDAVTCPHPSCNLVFDWARPADGDAIVCCPGCSAYFCASCQQTLDLHDSNFNHSCQASHRQKLEEALSYGAGAHCGNPECTARRVSVFKTRVGDCNAMRCRTCEYYFCYLCDVSLGAQNGPAHASFASPGKHLLDCPLFNSANEPEVVDAVRRRKTHAVHSYLATLDANLRAQVLESNRRLLQDGGVEVEIDGAQSPEGSQGSALRNFFTRMWRAFKGT
eukprot:TRINITY_DN12648_c0_g6_i1.p1 TRINITY_DN12648_c0_g6~~TRINITY_DN12648_c0_g6_i1.p1  ORF type:complete len:419 (+),score=30.58 TRINITY_DN12648_c0_g6_i1:53-1309(+)